MIEGSGPTQRLSILKSMLTGQRARRRVRARVGG